MPWVRATNGACNCAVLCLLQQRLPLTGPRLRAKVKAPRHDRYSLVLLNGDGLDLRLEGSVSFWGPTQKHLSLEQLYLPQTECFLMVLHIAA